MNKSKKIKKLITILSVVSIAGALLVVLILSYSPSPATQFDQFADSDRMARQILDQAADINNIQRSLQSFFQDNPLSRLTSYSRTELPARWGRVNPFIPFNLEQQLEAIREQGLQDLQQQQQLQQQLQQQPETDQPEEAPAEEETLEE